MFATDLDDTLYREIDFVKSGYRAIGHELERHGVISADEAVQIIEAAIDTEHGFNNLAAKIWMKNPGTPFTDSWMAGVYRTHRPDISLSKDVKDTLEKLVAHGRKIAIITDGRSQTQRLKIEALGLERYVEPQNIIISSEIGADKTTRRPFDVLAERNPDEKQFLFLGDNPAKDFLWPNAMGWTTVELLDHSGTNIHPQTINVEDDFRAQIIVNDFKDVLSLENKM